jgi:hypothetical protein
LRRMKNDSSRASFGGWEINLGWFQKRCIDNHKLSLLKILMPDIFWDVAQLEVSIRLLNERSKVRTLSSQPFKIDAE